MERRRKRCCPIDKGNGQETNSSSADYFGVKRDATKHKVDMRVNYRNKNIGKFFHRIHEEPTLVLAVFLVEIITHYGGRKAQKGGRKYKEMNLRALAHETFNRLPNIPEKLDEYLTTYIPNKEYEKVPEDYKRFIIETWNKHKEEVLRLVDSCVLQGTLHLRLLTENALTIPSIASYGEPEQLMSNMEVEEEQTPDQLETNYEKDRLLENYRIEMADLKASYEVEKLKNVIAEKENLKLKSVIAKLHAQLSSQKTNSSTTINDNQEIDECLRHVPPITREEASKIPTVLQCEDVPDVEQGTCSYFDITLDQPQSNLVDFSEAELDELLGDFEDISDLLPSDLLLSDLLPCDLLPGADAYSLSENIKSGAGVLSTQKEIEGNYNTASGDQEEQCHPVTVYDIPMISPSDLQEIIMEHPNGYANLKAGTSRRSGRHVSKAICCNQTTTSTHYQGMDAEK